MSGLGPSFFGLVWGFFHSGEGKLQDEVTTSFLQRQGPCSQPGSAGDKQLEQSHGAVCPADPTVPTVHICCSDGSTGSANPACSWCLSPTARVRINGAAHGQQSTRRNPQQRSSLSHWGQGKGWSQLYLHP